MRRSDSAVLGYLQTAKYELDKKTAELQQLVQQIQESLQFDYGLRDFGLPVPQPNPARSSHPNPFIDALQNVRLKSDLDLRIAGESFVGVKLVLPLGD